LTFFLYHRGECEIRGFPIAEIDFFNWMMPYKPLGLAGFLSAVQGMDWIAIGKDNAEQIHPAADFRVRCQVEMMGSPAALDSSCQQKIGGEKIDFFHRSGRLGYLGRWRPAEVEHSGHGSAPSMRASV
jgi:hypothetical protein